MMIEEAIWFQGNGEEVATWRIPGMSIPKATTQHNGMSAIARQDGATLAIEIKCNLLVK
ncbi:hypothetical protein DPMN_047100 [Dreissena polymorpha]|uniref:Uncharacterized protein n=1 Tax=Dreissena polymorpha TaxID=45954 RepID=A0A9D4I151_DREPO|nr:hypothetical protein DPMN_047100 [Dreissena polymorpha]